MTINAAAVDSSVAAASQLVVSLTEWAGSVYKHPDPQLLPLGECSRSFSNPQEEGTRKIALADLGRNDHLPYKIETHQTCCAKWVFANSCRRHLGIMNFRHMAETKTGVHSLRRYPVIASANVTAVATSVGCHRRTAALIRVAPLMSPENAEWLLIRIRGS
jgi:hypothetical protein